MAVLVDGREITLTGVVGDLYWDDDYFTQAEVISALNQLGPGPVTIRLNSGGGIASEGSAIRSAIRRHKGRKTIVVEGIAASAAFTVAMAADDLVVSPGSVMMLHDPSGITVGTAADHEAAIAELNAIGDTMADVYARKSGKTVAECRADMKAETWLTPEEAVAQGYADRVGEDAANDNEPTAFNYRTYQNPPERIVALADQRGWTKRQRPQAALPAATRQNKEVHMTDSTAGTQPAPEKTTLTQADIGAAVAAEKERNAAITAICNEGGQPAMATALIRSGSTAEQARARVNAAGQIKTMVATARKVSPGAVPEDLADTFLAEGKTVEQAKAALFDKLAAASEATATAAHLTPSHIEKSTAKAMEDSMAGALKAAGYIAPKGA